MSDNEEPLIYNMTYEDILNTIKEYLPIREEEKKKYGETFTPSQLINEMLDKLPTEIWQNKNLKWLDPANGIGNFPLIVYSRLMIGLKNQIKDVRKRKEHIILNMLYMVELNARNVKISRRIFGEDANIFCGNFLKDNFNEKFNFDIVLGNPPFQEQVGDKKTEPLWNHFIIKSLKNLNIDGYLLLVHPSGWRNVDGRFKNVQKEILTRDLKYLEIHNEKDGLKVFHTETRYDWYLLKNNKINKTETIIKFQDKELIVNVIGLDFIPNGNYDLISSMIAKNTEEKIDIMHNYSLYETRKPYMSKIKTDKNMYPCVYTVNSESIPTFFYSSVQYGHFGISKLIWSNGRISSVGSYIDDKGEYGLTQFSYAIVDVPENLKKIKKIFDSKKFRNLMEMCAVGQLTINHKIISLFKKDFWKFFEI